MHAKLPSRQRVFFKKNKQTNSDRSEKAHFAKVTDVEAE